MVHLRSLHSRPLFRLFPYTTLFRSVVDGGDLLGEVEREVRVVAGVTEKLGRDLVVLLGLGGDVFPGGLVALGPVVGRRSEEHTSELQSHSDLVCRLLLEKKKNLMER